MILAKAIDRFAESHPVCVMIRGSLEYALSEEFVNQVFEQTAERQYTRDLLFSDVVDLRARYLGRRSSCWILIND